MTHDEEEQPMTMWGYLLLECYCEMIGNGTGPDDGPVAASAIADILYYLASQGRNVAEELQTASTLYRIEAGKKNNQHNAGEKARRWAPCDRREHIEAQQLGYCQSPRWSYRMAQAAGNHR